MKLVESLAVISEPEARLKRLVEWCAENDPGVVVRALADIIDAAHLRNRNALAVLVDLPLLRTELPYAHAAALYLAADEEDLPQVKQLFAAGETRKQPPGLPDNAVFDKTLGERKALAMSKDCDVLDRLMRDRNEQVISILLRNPRITELDVVRIAAAPRVSLGAIEAIMNNHKWIRRYAVKKALVFNVYTPRNIARSLLPALQESDRLHAERLLSRPREV